MGSSYGKVQTCIKYTTGEEQSYQCNKAAKEAGRKKNEIMLA